MIPPSSQDSCSGVPTPGMLAGVTVQIEAEEDLTVQPCQPPQGPTAPLANGTEPHDTEQLAEVYVEVEAPEDLTVRPRASVAKAQDP